MKVTKRKVLEIQSAIEVLGSQKVDVQFAYALAKNKKIIENEVLSLREAGKAPTEFTEYYNQRMKIVSKYAAKNEDGTTKIIPGNSIMFQIVDQENFDKELEKLQKANKKIIEEQTKRDEQFDKILKEEIEIEFFPIQLSSIPKEIQTDIMTVLLPLIKE